MMVRICRTPGCGCSPTRAGTRRRRPLQSSPSRGVTVLLIATAALLYLPKALAAGQAAVEVLWDFDSSAQDWARASPTEMDAEVQWGPSGTLRGTVRGPMPHLDSPPFRVRVNDRCHVVIRMRSSGAATLGRLELRTGSIPKETDHSINPWTQRDSPAVVMTASSSGGSNATLAADGDLYTTWEASSDSNEWVTLDYGVPREVAAVRLKAPGGDSNPRNIRVQQGRSVGGEFVTAANLTMRNSSDSQQFVVSPSRSRFWRLYVLDTHGNASASLREVEFLGPGDTTVAKPLAFEIVNDDAFHVYHIPIHRSLQGILTQLRLRVGLEAAEDPGRTSASLSPKRGDAFEIDWIRVVRAPNVKRIRGCIDVSYLPPSTPEMGRAVAVFNGTARNVMVNGFLELGRTSLGRVEDAVYGTTKSCQREGGEMITLFGAAFGKDSAQVFVDGNPCTGVTHTVGHEETELSCRLPPMSTWPSSPAGMSFNTLHDGSGGSNATTSSRVVLDRKGEMAAATDSVVQVVNGRMTGLSHGVPYLSYQAPIPPLPERPVVSNQAARSLDLSWKPPSDIWDALAVTGYQIGWRTLQDNSSLTNASEFESIRARLRLGEEEVQNLMNVGNVTTTTVRDLAPGTKHAFWVRAVAENRSHPAWDQVDLYGRRDLLDGAVVGYFSDASKVADTLAEDILFDKFNANSTLNHSSEEAVSTLGPRGQWAGEGHYGLKLVGTAQVENCNRSASCCDVYDESAASCAEQQNDGELLYSCSAGATARQMRAFNTEKTSSPVSSGAVTPYIYAVEAGWGGDISHACGPALRLTASYPASAGAAWYPRDVTISEGFDTTFAFRLSSPSLRCNTMDGVHTYCRSRGADGLAFVVQGEGSTALGSGGMGMGYVGISNMLAVEFDTFYNPDLLEPYENHVSVQTRGWRDAGSAHDSYSLGSTPNVPDLTDGEIVTRVVYRPIVQPQDIFGGDAFQATAHAGHFMSNNDFSEGGMADWGTGIGILSVYVNNLHEPCLVIPLNLESTLRLHHGRAFVGFTAATGRDTWQVHDVLRWSFSGLRLDKPFWAPPVTASYNRQSMEANNSCSEGDFPCIFGGGGRGEV